MIIIYVYEMISPKTDTGGKEQEELAAQIKYDETHSKTALEAIKRPTI